MKRVLLDTHVLIWWLSEPARLSRAAERALGKALKLELSPISFWEVGMLAQKQRLQLDRDLATWVDELVRLPAVSVEPMTAAIGAFAGSMDDFHGDPADRIIYATARLTNLTLLTADRRIADYALGTGDVDVLW